MDQPSSYVTPRQTTHVLLFPQNPLIRPSTGPDLAATTSPELLRGLAAIVNETGVFVQVVMCSLVYDTKNRYGS